MRTQGREPRMPEAPLPYLIDYLFEVGPASGGGFGPVPVTFVEIDAWARRVPRGIQPFEAIYIKRLSELWVRQLAQSEDEGAPAPWSAEVVTSDERVAVGDSLRDSIRAMAKKG